MKIVASFFVRCLPILVSTALADDLEYFPVLTSTSGPVAGIHVGDRVGHRPAGKYGGVLRKGEGFILEKKQDVDFRIFGVNLNRDAAVPPKSEAGRIAAHLAAMGFNAVRFHHIFQNLASPGGEDSQSLSEEALDRLDYFLAQLKEEGIYFNINLQTMHWTYKAGDKVAQYQSLDSKTRAVHFFDPRLIDIQKRYAERLLGRTNRYTGVRLSEDPALAVVEILNETSLFGGGETGGDLVLPSSYRQELDILFCQYLNEKYGTTASLARAWGKMEDGESLESSNVRCLRIASGVGTKARLLDTALFYVETERHFYATMSRFLRKDLGYRGLINGNNNWYGLFPLYSQRECDFMDVHGYFAHPILPSGKFTTSNYLSMQFLAANYPEGYRLDKPLAWPNILPTHKWALGAVEGMPLVSSEWNSPAPHFSMHEAPVLVSAYASFQGLSGIYYFAYDNVVGNPTSHFFHLHPALFAQMPLAALAFRRGDVSQARETLTLSFEEGELLDSHLQFGKAFSHNINPELPISASLIHKVRKRIGVVRKDPPLGKSSVDSFSQNPYRSDTGELIWDNGDHEHGLVTVDTPRFQAVLSAGGKRQDVGLSVMGVKSEQTAAFSAVSLDGEPLSISKEIFLTVVGLSEYSGQTWKGASRETTVEYGSLPGRFAPVPAEIRFKRKKNLRLRALDAGGKITAEIPARNEGGVLVFRIGSEKTLWYRLAEE